MVIQSYMCWVCSASVRSCLHIAPSVRLSAQVQCNIDVVTVTAGASRSVLDRPQPGRSAPLRSAPAAAAVRPRSSLLCPPPPGRSPRVALPPARCRRCDRQAPFNEDKCQLFVFYSVRSTATQPQQPLPCVRPPNRVHGPVRASPAHVAACPSAVFHPIYAAVSRHQRLTTVSINY